MARISRGEGRQLLKVVVCLRRVPDTATRIKIASDGKSIDTSDAEFVINPYEEYALEQAVQLKEKLGGEVTVVTLGPEKTTQVIMKALALGADKAIHLKSDKIPDDPGSTAKALANELKGLEFDVLLFGKKGIDDDNQQVGQMVKLEVSERKAVAHREVEGGSIMVETTLPATFTAEKDLTVPRYASLRELVAARKKPIVVKDIQLSQSSIEIVSIQNPPPRPAGKIVGRGVDAVPILVKLLHEEAKVI